ncbi:Rpn family recombination-promoting nuclease/putative transposase [Bacillaceae bacterium Marseille-Q3522]|nr:Rpn family recombination-promoting nuclease/putative transposase [Bacillaceae bacterium Marseille-Q3522]
MRRGYYCPLICDKQLTKTITINIINFTILKEPYYHHVFYLKDAISNHILTKNQEIHFIEMEKFRDAHPNLENPLDRWLLFLDENTPTETMKEVTRMDPLIKEAEEKMEILKHDPQAKEQYESWAKLLSDYVSALGSAERKGKEEGRQEGIEEGKLEVAVSLLRTGMPYDLIAKVTGIPLEKIKKQTR